MSISDSANRQEEIQSFFNSVFMSLLTAVFGTVFVFVYTYLIEKGKGMKRMKKIGKLLSVVPIALPGMVIGLSFIFFFNSRSNPLNVIYRYRCNSGSG